jgi:hypothetical protein
MSRVDAFAAFQRRCRVDPAVLERWPCSMAATRRPVRRDSQRSGQAPGAGSLRDRGRSAWRIRSASRPQPLALRRSPEQREVLARMLTFAIGAVVIQHRRTGGRRARSTTAGPSWCDRGRDRVPAPWCRRHACGLISWSRDSNPVRTFSGRRERQPSGAVWQHPGLLLRPGTRQRHHTGLIVTMTVSETAKDQSDVSSEILCAHQRAAAFREGTERFLNRSGSE